MTFKKICERKKERMKQEELTETDKKCKNWEANMGIY